MASGTQTIAGVERALDVLSLFAESGASDLGVTEIAEELDLSKAVVHRILSSFRVKGFIELDADTRRYRIGPRTLTVGMSYLKRIDQLEVARAALIRLAEESGETATQSVRAGRTAVYVGQVASQHQIRVVVSLGMAFPLHVGSESKVLLAAANGSSLADYLDEGQGEGHDIDVQALADELREIVRSGYAVSWGEREPGVASVSAPVCDHADRVVAALTISGPEGRVREDIEKHVQLVTEVAERASDVLGDSHEQPVADRRQLVGSQRSAV